jgi:outer membrane protein assembly factor BamD
MCRRLAPFLALAVAVAACKSSGPKRTFESPAEEDYVVGVEDLKAENFPEAQRLFERVRNKYPYSKYAALSELRLADLRYDQGRFVEAAEAYQTFVKLHPNHPEIDYAAWRTALSRWEDAPSDFFAFPPVYERDLAQVALARDALEAFIKKYPDSTYAPEARKLLAKAKGVLAQRDWYVAGFYRDRGKWQGAAYRLERILKEFPGSDKEPEALYQLAEMYLKLGERFRAQQALQQLVVRHPESKLKAPAEKLLADVRTPPK